MSLSTHLPYVVSLHWWLKICYRIGKHFVEVGADSRLEIGTIPRHRIMPPPSRCTSCLLEYHISNLISAWPNRLWQQDRIMQWLSSRFSSNSIRFDICAAQPRNQVKHILQLHLLFYMLRETRSSPANTSLYTTLYSSTFPSQLNYGSHKLV